MIALLCFFLALFVSPFKPKSRLEAENAALRHQLIVLQRMVRGRVQLTNGDRLFLVQLYRWFPSVLKAITIIRPETLVRWHRAGFRRYWRWKSRSLGGRPQIDVDLRALIRRMSAENPLWGAPRIHGELLKLGFEVAQSSVAKYMAIGRIRPAQAASPSAECSCDRQDRSVPTRRAGTNNFSHFWFSGTSGGGCCGFAVTHNPTAEWLARQITEAFPWDSAPKYLIRDNDRAFGVAFKARVRAMGIRDRPTSYRSPWQNGYVERLIGSIRRECTDHLLVFNVEHLRRILSKYASYYNEARTHVSLGKDAPCRRPIEQFGDIVAYPILGGPHHRYARI